jgi:hypothetical protein
MSKSKNPESPYSEDEIADLRASGHWPKLEETEGSGGIPTPLDVFELPNGFELGEPDGVDPEKESEEK